MGIKAKIEFLKIPRPPYAYRYTGKSCWVRMDSDTCSDLAVCLGFDDGQEYYDGDSAIATLSFFQHESVLDKFFEGMIFSLRVLDLEIATGRILSVSR